MLDCFQVNPLSFSKGEIIFTEGECADFFGIVICGKVQIERIDFYGNRSIMADVEQGELFGESFACAGAAVWPVNVVASEDSEVILINCHRISEPCSKACTFHGRMIFNLMKIISVKNLILHQKIEIISKRTTREKLRTYLLIQAKEHGSSFTIPYDRQSLADYLEVDRSGLSAEISKLRKEGILESSKNRFTLLQYKE